MPELPFCPGGGPPGWFNHFNYKRDQNIWHHQNAYRNSDHHRHDYQFNNTPARPALNNQQQPYINRQNRSHQRWQYYQTPAQTPYYHPASRLQDGPRNR